MEEVKHTFDGGPVLLLELRRCQLAIVAAQVGPETGWCRKSQYKRQGRTASRKGLKTAPAEELVEPLKGGKRVPPSRAKAKGLLVRRKKEKKSKKKKES